MNASRRGTRSAKDRPHRWFVPLHSGRVLEALAGGIVDLRGAEACREDLIAPQLLDSATHGVDYGQVALLEFPASAGGASSRDWVLLSECGPLWVESQSALDELSVMAATFPDLVGDAVSMRVDQALFAGIRERASGRSGEQAPELDLVAKVEPTACLEVVKGRRDAKIVGKISGAIAFARHRAIVCGTSLGNLAKLFTSARAADGADAGPEGVVASAFFRAVRPADEAIDELLFQLAASMLAQADPRDGLAPIDFLGRLADAARQVGEAQLEARVSKLAESVRRILRSEEELGPDRISDERNVGMRALMLFLMAPGPAELGAWFAARPGVGRDVSFLACFLGGIHAGLSVLPAATKGPGRQPFLAAVTLARQFVHGEAKLESSLRWEGDGSRVTRLCVEGLEFARHAEPPPPALRSLLAIAKDLALHPCVDGVNGEVSVSPPGGEAVVVSLGASAWLQVTGEVVTFRLAAIAPGRGALSREFLERLLSPLLPPVWCVQGDRPRLLELRAEAVASDPSDFRRALSCLSERMAWLGLQPAQAKAPGADRRRGQ